MENLRLIYVENAKVAAVFWDWRHKTLTIFFTGIAGVAVAAAWVANHHPGALVALPLFLGALFSGVAFGLNWRTTSILGECYAIGASLETAFLADTPALLGEQQATFSRLGGKRLFGRVLAGVYCFSAVGQTGLAIAALFVRPHI